MRNLIVATLVLIACPTVDAVAQPFEDQIDGKTGFIPSTGQIIEDVRVVSLQDTTFLVTRPVIMTFGGRTYPKMQTWMRLGEKTDFFVVDSRGQAEQLKKRHTSEKMLEQDAEAAAKVKYRFFEHPSRNADPFEGKSLVAYTQFFGHFGDGPQHWATPLSFKRHTG
ncbi:MAG: hypothetical protein NXI04_00595 [Planctomycetaceae bacterium]|nr:hypothetical protein [Planctomycetaceae bacterium]